MSQDKEPTGKSRTRKSTAATKKAATSKDNNDKVTNPTQEQQTLKIEVSRFGSIVNALSGDKWWRIVISVFFIGCVLFSGIALVAIAIKKLYPYSDITTNGLGATTIKSEKGEVSYWLFNTASLWANSGITVEEGDVITIRSSGKFHSAIHHLYDATKENTELKDDWIGPEGVKDNRDDNSGDYQRSRYRIFPGLNSNALVMQVVNDKAYDSAADTANGAKPDNFYYIGDERQHIYINHPGTLHFAVNDIVLNGLTIRNMLLESIEDSYYKKNKQSEFANLASKVKHDVDSVKSQKKIGKYDKDVDTVCIAELSRLFGIEYGIDLKFLGEVNKNKETFEIAVDLVETDLEKEMNPVKVKKPEEIISIIENKITFLSSIEGGQKKYPNRILKRINKLSFDSEYDKENVKEDINALVKELRGNRAIGSLKLGVTKDEYGETVCELEYYHKKEYKTAWFDDNVGSLLIVIEKESH